MNNKVRANVSLDIEMTDKVKETVDLKSFLEKHLSDDYGIKLKVNDVSIQSDSINENKKDDILKLHAVNPKIDNECLSFQASDIFIEILEKDGKYAVNDNGKPKFGMWFDNIGLFTVKLHPCTNNICVGIYGRKDNKYAMIYHQGNDGHRFMYCTDNYNWYGRPILPEHKYITEYLDSITSFQEYTPYYNATFNEDGRHYQGKTINWIKDETIILDKNTKLVPGFYVGGDSYYYLYVDGKKVNYFYSTGKEYLLSRKNADDYIRWNRFLEDFIKQFRYAEENDPELLAKLKKGVGYEI